MTPLRRALADLAERGVESLVLRRAPRHRRQAFLDALPWLALAPALVVVLQVLRFAASNGPLPLGPAGLVATTLSIFGFLWLWNLTAGRPPRPGTSSGLLAADRALGAEDRLVAADEFLRRPRRSPFEEAAIRDAERFVEERAGHPWPPPVAVDPPLPSLPGRALSWGGIAAVLLVAGAAMNGIDVRRGASPSSGPAGVGSPPPRSLAAAPRAERDLPRVTEPRAEERERRARGEVDAAPADAESVTEAGESTRAAKESSGRTGAGRSAGARSLTGASDSRGVPTSRAQTSKEPPRDPSRTPSRPPSKPPEEDDERPPKDAPPEESGATAGRGAARGSNRNPASTDWSSKDQVTTPDEEELAEDEDVEDETDENEARGGTQPTLRDRRPPVSRDLQIGFGNGRSDDANGRGGPSQQKKSRGTASLVLGVPIPDRVKGQPNPGQTKVTQERVEPRREEASPATAEARPPRAGALGPLAPPALPPWLLRLLQDHTARLRAAPPGDVAPDGDDERGNP